MVDNGGGDFLGIGLRLPAGDQIVQRDIEISGQGGQVVHVRPAAAGLPFLDRLPGHPQQIGQPLLTQPCFFPQLIETVLKFHRDSSWIK